MYEGLINENGLTSKLEPGLAESWEVSKDGKKIVFTLREGLKWSDGEPMTTDDIIFSYDKIYFNDKIPSGLKDTLRVGMSANSQNLKKLTAAALNFRWQNPSLLLLDMLGESQFYQLIFYRNLPPIRRQTASLNSWLLGVRILTPKKLSVTVNTEC